MTDRLSLFPRIRVGVLLLLAIIGLQATAPIRAPLERVPGPAFSSATIDVTLASAWRTEATTALAQTKTAILPIFSKPVSRLAEVTIPVLPRHFRLVARGPPPRTHPARLPDSTAPPFA